MRTIVVGTDGSQDAMRAVRFAAEMAAGCGASLHVASSAHVAAELASMTFEPMILPDDFDTQALAAARAAVDRAIEEVGPLAVPVEGHVLTGEAANALIHLCQELDADVLVVGSKGMTGAARFLIGSVANRCAHHARCTVVLVK